MKSKELKAICFCAAGGAVALASLWGGAYALVEVFPYPHWGNMPAFMTAMFAFFGGCGLCGYGISTLA